MRSRHIVAGVALALVTHGAAGLGRAQPVPAFNDLSLALNVGDRVRIEDRDGSRYEGTVRTLPPETLVVVAADGPHTFTADTTARVQRRGDPVWTGALLGFVPGFAMGAGFVSGFSDHEEPLTTYVAAGGLVGLAGAGVGVVIDSLHRGLRDVWVAGRPPAVGLAPLVGHGRLGAFASIRW